MFCLARRFALLLCLLALWLQMLAPALALGMQKRTFGAVSTICHGDVSTHHEGEPRAPQPLSCDHCLVCHLMAGTAPDDERPAFTLFDYPDVSSRRWAALIRSPVPAQIRRTSPPRGPPISV